MKQFIEFSNSERKLMKEMILSCDGWSQSTSNIFLFTYQSVTFSFTLNLVCATGYLSEGSYLFIRVPGCSISFNSFINQVVFNVCWLIKVIKLWKVIIFWQVKKSHLFIRLLHLFRIAIQESMLVQNSGILPVKLIYPFH